MHSLVVSFFLFLNFNLESVEGREKEREINIDVREKHQLVAFCKCPGWGQSLQPRHVP